LTSAVATQMILFTVVMDITTHIVAIGGRTHPAVSSSSFLIPPHQDIYFDVSMGQNGAKFKRRQCLGQDPNIR
jgi:hypothetical protein